jgi:hypothetical protein
MWSESNKKKKEGEEEDNERGCLPPPKANKQDLGRKIPLDGQKESFKMQKFDLKQETLILYLILCKIIL